MNNIFFRLFDVKEKDAGNGYTHSLPSYEEIGSLINIYIKTKGARPRGYKVVDTIKLVRSNMEVITSLLEEIEEFTYMYPDIYDFHGSELITGYVCELVETLYGSFGIADNYSYKVSKEFEELLESSIDVMVKARDFVKLSTHCHSRIEGAIKDTIVLTRLYKIVLPDTQTKT